VAEAGAVPVRKEKAVSKTSGQTVTRRLARVQAEELAELRAALAAEREARENAESKVDALIKGQHTANAQIDALRAKLERVRNKCEDHFGERTACGQCYDSILSHLNSTRAKLEAVRRETLEEAAKVAARQYRAVCSAYAAVQAGLHDPGDGIVAANIRALGTKTEGGGNG
jgi:chromosome segregation ATPase